MQDIRTAFRALTARPGFTLVAILTLALGIGANTAMYTVVHAILLAPLPYAEPGRVVVLNEVAPRFPNPISVSWQNYMDWRDRSRSFDTVAAMRTTQVTLTGAGEPERIPVRMVTATLLAYTVSQRTQEIGVRTALGASQQDVVRLVLGQGLGLAAAGIAIGLAGAAVAARVLDRLLFQTSGLDPLTFTAAAAVVGIATLTASCGPARRASRVAPVIALNR